ncbi:MAG: pilus assembly protein PilX [Gammaproteobacteria bacterium]|nr:pilus assembly protein PilX [Gammaproteobacteria bacterium]
MSKWKQQARGSVLIVSLVILLVLTLLGISGMDGTVMQERMAGNMQEGLSGFQAAEAGLRDGELEARVSLDPTTVFTTSCTGGLCEPADPASADYDVWVTSTSSAVYWDSSDATNDRNTREYGDNTANTSLQNVSRQPAYIVERLQVVERGASIVAGFASQPSSEWYRVTARGFGRNGQSQSTLQSVIRK